tara:strand:+ start:9279 stop:10181 length:903 start_codon:yes stop_codon:yes gene_type:complete
MHKMKILLTGSTGQLGKAILSTKPDNIDLLIPERKNFDLSRVESCKKIILKEKPDWIINCAAYTAVDKAEEEIELSKNINSYAPEAFAKCINEYNGNLLQISTDFVFNGEQNYPYLENQITNPINHYGYTKALGESLITKALKCKENGTILRTSWVISPIGNNFILTMLRLHSDKNFLNVVNDQIGAPTSSKDLAIVCWEIIKLKKAKNLPFILHWSDAGVTSWYDIAEAVGEIGIDLGILERKAKINPIKSIQYPTLAKRPKYSLLNTTNTSELLEKRPIHWRENLKRILIDYKKLNLN